MSSTDRRWYPLAIPTLGFEEVHDAIDVLQSGQTTMGERVEEFEEQFARHVGAEYGVMVNSGSSADLLIALSAPLHKGPPFWGDVLLPVVTWPTHVWSWANAGIPMSFVDADPLNVSVDSLAAKLTPAVEAVHVAHLMGVPCDMGPIREVIGDRLLYEDCCEALGAEYDGQPVGTFGEAASWSFFFSHHITTMEGGMVTTSDPDLASRFRSLRSHGWARHAGGDPYTFVMPGFNLRPTEIAAAIGLVQLSKLGHMNKVRQENFDLFVKTLDGNPLVSLPEVPAKGKASWFGLPLFVQEPFSRDHLVDYLEDKGIETRPILGGNLLRQPAFASFPPTPMPGADRLHDNGFYIGLHPNPDTGVDQVAALINEYVPVTKCSVETCGQP